ncbi:MAG: flagellar basal body-associated FliL family protein [Bdellovibrionaceae bacterium]|nr:flagellar basal body-associated FliL family protein [Pseudobdellovibrionaceae bacterium]MDW8190719.1 flagellar basal body-associated FliL family protein [Pseudobdellovibrionaceae bacterium]
MAQTPAEKDPQSGPSKRDWKFILFLAFGFIQISVVIVSVIVVYLNTLGYQPPVVLEQELAKLDEERLRLMEEGRRPTAALSLVEAGLPNFHPLMVPFEEIVTNLNGLPQRMIKVSVTFKVLDDFTYQEIMSPAIKTKIRDQIIKVLQSTEFHEIDSLSGKLILKDAILQSINRVLEEGVIRDVYFTEFVVQ